MTWNLFFRKWDKPCFKSWGGLIKELQGKLRHGSRNQPVEQVCANDVATAVARMPRMVVLTRKYKSGRGSGSGMGETHGL